MWKLHEIDLIHCSSKCKKLIYSYFLLKEASSLILHLLLSLHLFLLRKFLSIKILLFKVHIIINYYFNCLILILLSHYWKVMTCLELMCLMNYCYCFYLKSFIHLIGLLFIHYISPSIKLLLSIHCYHFNCFLLEFISTNLILS
jgi:hypothetical protein